MPFDEVIDNVMKAYDLSHEDMAWEK